MTEVDRSWKDDLFLMFLVDVLMFYERMDD